MKHRTTYERSRHPLKERALSFAELRPYKKPECGSNVFLISQESIVRARGLKANLLPRESISHESLSLDLEALE